MSIELLPGDIGATKGENVLGWLHRKLFAPETDRFHYFILWRWLGDDWIILESLGSKGLAVGLLSFYQGEDVKFYRVDCPDELRHAASLVLIKYGRSRYDYLLILKIIAGALVAIARMIFVEKRLRKLKSEDLPYARSNALICTEAVDVAYLSVGVSLVGEVVPLPSAFRQAELDGIIYQVREFE